MKLRRTILKSSYIPHPSRNLNFYAMIADSYEKQLYHIRLEILIARHPTKVENSSHNRDIIYEAQ